MGVPVICRKEKIPKLKKKKFILYYPDPLIVGVDTFAILS